MEKAGADKIVYTDTDSIMFLSPKDSNPLEDEISNFFGSLSNEIQEDEEITEVIIVAPKSYCYTIKSADGQREIKKMKGIRQNSESDTLLTVENYRKLVENGVRAFLTGEENSFGLDIYQSTIKKRRTLGLTTEFFIKKITTNSRKGIIRGVNSLDAIRLPFGFKD